MKKILGVFVFAAILAVPALASAADKLPSGFIALAPDEMNWNNAVAFCKQKGGRLPRINNSDSWDGKNPPSRGIVIDGFGYGDRPWEEVGLPTGYYWTGTEGGVNPGDLWYVSGGDDLGAEVIIHTGGQSLVNRAACVPYVGSTPEEADSRKEEARKARYAEELNRAKEAGFIALSESPMNWNDAKAFCQQKGGRLPRINNSDSWDGKKPPLRGIVIDGFGYGERPWEEVGLPSGDYWTGTVDSIDTGDSWSVVGYNDEVLVSTMGQSDGCRVVCVPFIAAAKTEAARQKMLEENRRKEEARKARYPEELRKAKEAGFIALSESDMNWNDAKAFCQQHGGRLPRINNSDSWNGENPSLRGILIDGFGAPGAPWPSGLPSGGYWTGTEGSSFTGTSWRVSAHGVLGAGVNVGDYARSADYRVVCVP